MIAAFLSRMTETAATYNYHAVHDDTQFSPNVAENSQPIFSKSGIFLNCAYSFNQ